MYQSAIHTYFKFILFNVDILWNVTKQPWIIRFVKCPSRTITIILYNLFSPAPKVKFFQWSERFENQVPHLEIE